MGSRQTPAGKRSRAAENRASILFVGRFAALVLIFGIMVRLPLVQEQFLLPYTHFIGLLTSGLFGLIGVPVEVDETILRHSSASVDIRRGCDGVVATIILVSACLAYPALWSSRLFGVLAGFGMIFLANLLRIMVLFGLIIQDRIEVFHLVHTYVAQFAVIFLALVFWVYWAGRQSPETV